MRSRFRLLLSVGTGTLALVFAAQAFAAPPATPDLVAGSDTGSSSTDNVTNDTTPDISVANPLGEVIRLCIVAAGGSGGGVDHGTSSANPATFTASTLTDGSWDVTARNGSTNCTDGEVSGLLKITVDTLAPIVLTQPTLHDFVGSNPSVTFTSTPRFNVLVETGATVTLHEGAATIGSGTSVDNNALALVSTPLADGSHTIFARGTDAAGNTSADSPSATITVDSTAASAGTPDLIDDDGASASDNYTSNPRPRFQVATEPGARVTIYEDGIALGSALADGTGIATVKPRADLWLDPGFHCIYAIAMDTLANAGQETAELCITIAPGVEPFTSNLGLSLAPATLKVSLRSTMAARVTIKVKRKGRVLMTVKRNVRAERAKRMKLRLNRAARRAAKRGNKIVVVMTLRSDDGRRVVVRRAVRL